MAFYFASVEMGPGLGHDDGRSLHDMAQRSKKLRISHHAMRVRQKHVEAPWHREREPSMVSNLV